jgi:flagellar biosynthesis anti-sigma factor FlgM
MKIENSGITGLTPNNKADAAQRVSKRSANPVSAPATQGTDKAELSEKARMLAKARAVKDTSLDEPESEKVAQIRAQVENGTYEIQYDAIAKKLMSTGVFA